MLVHDKLPALPCVLDCRVARSQLSRRSYKCAFARCRKAEEATLIQIKLVSVDSPQAPLTFDYAQAKVAQDHVNVLDEVSEGEQGQS